MPKWVTGDGRTHIESSLMRESLVDRRVIAGTHAEQEFEILPDVTLVSIGGQSRVRHQNLDVLRVRAGISCRSSSRDVDARPGELPREASSVKLEAHVDPRPR